LAILAIFFVTSAD